MKIVGALLSALLVFASGQVLAKRGPPLTEEDRVVAQVFEAPGHDREQIYSAMKMWIAENFKSAKAVIEYESKEEGVIVGNGSIGYACDGGFACRIREGAWRFGFTMKAEAKDGRFRLTFTNVHLLLPPYNNMGTSLPSREEPITQREDMESARAKLLEFGPQIVASIDQAKAGDDW